MAPRVAVVIGEADAYERYWRQNGVAPLEAKCALGVEMLREDRETETEFVISNAIRNF